MPLGRCIQRFGRTSRLRLPRRELNCTAPSQDHLDCRYGYRASQLGRQLLYALDAQCSRFRRIFDR
jgi:hypothetical protein